MFATSFLFCDPVSPERLRWFSESIGAAVRQQYPGEEGTFTIFFTGDALYSLADARTHDAWAALAVLRSVRIVADGDELRLQGMRGPVLSKNPRVIIPGDGTDRTTGAFWDLVVSTLKGEWRDPRQAAFLLCTSPYMNRTPVYMLRFLAGVHASGLRPELYTYLDGVHTVHNGQCPSEFENIGRGVAALAGSAAQSGRDAWFAACSRCATARGYYQMNPGTGFCEPSSCIESITIRPLRDILARFRERHPVLSHASGYVVARDLPAPGMPHLVIFITNPPYCTEWTFGGISLAVAAAMDGIPVTVIFIEDGVHALCGTHEVPAADKIFNIQEMLAATLDVEGLQYLVHGPSLEVRGVRPAPEFQGLRQVHNQDLAGILGGTGQENAGRAKRMIFF
ncbi:hypothetical protein ASZ90_016587 [hydrocarbon metagenome]|uniref:Uncharacterized protein n=1 Tax=hydrocarbon metagenome TaxID=938273 RepID=A0A0W8EN91_9ZZZZ